MYKKIITTLFCTVFFISALWFLNFTFPSASMTQRILQNDTVSAAKIIDRKFDIFSDKYEIEIHTENGYTIILHNTKWSLRNKGIRISQINDIHYQGGKTYEIPKESGIWYYPNDIVLLGKMLGIKLKSVDDIINNIDELYKLYELFEQNSRKDFLYKESFLMNADFSKTTECYSEKIIRE